MEQVLQDLIMALRASGVRISVSENIDAMNAVRLLGYAHRQQLKDSLSATLAKSLHETEIFETCFDRFFSLDNFSDSEIDSGVQEEIAPDNNDSPLTQMLLSGDQAGLSLSMRQATQEIGITGIRFFTQKSLYIQRILKGMGLEGLDRDIRNLRGDDRTYSQEKARVLKGTKDLLFENVRDFVEQQYSLFAASANEEILEKYLKRVRLSNLEQQDFARMREIMRKMVKRLNDLHSRRRKSCKRGRLDLKRTLRANLAYQGTLFDLRWKSKKIDRPNIIVLCDVSRSVDAVARFLLLFLYSLNEELARIRSFIFCSNLVEVTHVFEEYDVEEALVRLQKGAGLGVLLGRTDYGQVFRDFKETWLETVTRKTTFLILGDARNNYADPEAGILKLLYERSKRLIWLNPESPPFWGTGDSAMKTYLPYCSMVQKCSTVSQLERVVGSLLRMRAT
ncbi:MAG: VWA domain-containing protein [Desulfobacteraceae bacterium]|nr:VWA domain-containing protein [Desulfobacteraceae bacterium]